MVLDDDEARHLRHLSLFRKFMFAVVATATLLSLLAVPLRVAMVRDQWPRPAGPGHESQDDADPTITPWVYSVVASWEVLHLLLMLYAFMAVLHTSAWKSLVTSLLCVLLAIAFLVALLCLGSYGFVAASAVLYVVLAFLFAFFGQYVLYEELPIDFVVRTRDGKTSPLLA